MLATFPSAWSTFGAIKSRHHRCTQTGLMVKCSTPVRVYQSGLAIVMQRVTIYLTTLCPFCWRAKRLLDVRGVSYEEINIMDDPGLRSEMVNRAGGESTVPQIFIAGQHIGGSDELTVLEKTGKLDLLLNAK